MENTNLQDNLLVRLLTSLDEGESVLDGFGLNLTSGEAGVASCCAACMAQSNAVMLSSA